MSLTLHQPNLPSLSSSHPCGQSWHHTSNVDISLLLKPRERDREREIDHQDKDNDDDTTANTDGSSLSLAHPHPPPVSPVRVKDQDCDGIPSPPQSVARIAPSSVSTPSTISKHQQSQPNPHPSPSLAPLPPVSTIRPTTTTSVIPAKRSSSHLNPPQHNTRSTDPYIHNSHSHPAKKQSKWSPHEDSKIISLRAEGMKWEDISRHLPGRSAISCRLHYQNYLERRSEWDEDRKDRLARLYERFKQEMWSKIAEEMAIPWRAAEAMHWQIGETDMARRAGVTPFSLALNNNNGSSNSSNNGSGGGGGGGSGGGAGALGGLNGSYHSRSTNHRQNMSISRSSLPGNDGPEYAQNRLLGSGIGQQQLPSLAELTAGLPAFHHPSIHPLLPTHHGLGLPPGLSATGNGSGGGGGGIGSSSNGNGSAYSYSHHGHHSHGHHSRGHSFSHSHSDTRTPIPGTPYSSGLPYPGSTHGHVPGYAHGLIPSPVRGGVGADFFLKRS